MSEWERKIASLNLVGYQKHVFLCVGESCGGEQGERTWQFLKARLGELGLSKPGQVLVHRSKSPCLRICGGGPILVIYPDGVWYRQVNEAICERIISEHLVDGNRVEEALLCQNQVLGKGPSG